MERALVADYEADVDRLLAELTPGPPGLAAQIAAVPQQIRGFGHVKAAGCKARAERQRLWKEWDVSYQTSVPAKAGTQAEPVATH